MIKRGFLLLLATTIYLFARGDAPIVFEDTPVIDGVHKSIKHHKKKVYKKRYKKHSTYKRYRARKNDALVAKDELVLPNE